MPRIVTSVPIWTDAIVSEEAEVSAFSFALADETHKLYSIRGNRRKPGLSPCSGAWWELFCGIWPAVELRVGEYQQYA